jgi:hypothetical protein
MKRVRALAARVLRLRGAVPAAESVTAPVSAATGRRRAFVLWVEDHAERLILTSLGVMAALVVILLLWKTARVISVAQEFQPVLGAVAAVTTISFTVLAWLKGRRDRRLNETASVLPPAAADDVSPAAESLEVEPGPEPGSQRDESPPDDGDAHGSGD